MFAQDGAASEDGLCYKSCEGENRIKPSRQHSEVFWWTITSFQGVYSMINTGMGLCILPLEAERLNKSNASIWVGVYLIACGIAQLICPWIGKLSDRFESEYGRRRPFIAAGAAWAILSLGVIHYASVNLMPNLFLFSLLSAQISLNVVFSAQCGLPADLQGDAEGRRDAKESGTTGVVSGYVAIHCFTGSLAAVAVIIATHDQPVQVQYICFMILVAVSALLVCNTVKEASSVREDNEITPSMTIADVTSIYTLDLEKDRDFFWVCLGRLFYYITTSVAVFLLYYIRDMVGVHDQEELRVKLAMLIVIAQLVGAFVTIPAGRASNTLGRKPVIYASCVIMSSTFILYCIGPKMPPENRWNFTLAAGTLYGMGSGIYLSVDYALALDCLPSGKSAAEAFGLWGVAGFIGSTVGPMIAGLLLASNEVERKPGVATTQMMRGHYGYLGYALVMLILGCCMNVIVVLATHKIKGTK
eukprot:TRINITY_DN6816_c0_g1_i2.p1 TRINITY_DN6816_c0_g1~~TRINITY_DN6816_c0_g1_i2.p1  ORF type:complete len:507 (-),score=72.82 TRINITY_DN6816_c0_g1_i2:606-2024(-)